MTTDTFVYTVLPNAEVAYGVLSGGGEFHLVNLRNADECAKRTGFVYCGMLAVVNGRPVVHSEPYPDALETVMAACGEFMRLEAHRLAPGTENVEASVSTQAEDAGNAVDWLTSLHALTDSRKPGD